MRLLHPMIALWDVDNNRCFILTSNLLHRHHICLESSSIVEVKNIISENYSLFYAIL